MTGFWDRYTRQRIGRRRMMAGSLAAGAGAAFWACGASSDAPLDATRTASSLGYEVLNGGGEPRYGGTLRLAFGASFGTWDPHLGSAGASPFYPRIYNVLVNQSATRPEFMFFDLAESLEFPDDTTFIFKIRPGVMIAPNDLGVPERALDGEDVRASIERIKSDPASQNHSFARDHVASVAVEGDAVRIETPGPYAWFINRIGLFLNAIVPRELLAGDVSRLSNRGAGGGPYRLASAVENDAARLERNTNYYRRDAANGEARLPYLDNIEVRVIFDRAAQRAAFISGQLHQLLTGSSAEARSVPDAVIDRNPAFTYISFTMDPRRKPFDDPRVRRAISRAIDRQKYVDLVYGGDAQANGLVQWSLGSYALPPEELATVRQPYDVAEARALVEQVGGIRMKMSYPASTSILEHDKHLPIFLEQMRAANIEIEHDPQDFGTWVTNYIDANYECSLALNQIYETPEIPLLFHTAAGPLADGSVSHGTGERAVEEAIRRANMTLDAEERIDAVREAQRVIYDHDPISLPLVTPFFHLLWRPEVRNIPVGLGTTSFLINSSWLG